MTKQQFHTKANYYLAILTVFSLPFARLTPLFIALMLLNWLVEGDFTNKLTLLSKNKLALLFIAFYGMHVIGMIYTENTNSGWFDLQVKFSLFAFPLMLASRPFNNKETDTLFLSLIAGGIINSLFLLGRAFYYYFYLSENCFFYQAFSFLLHPSYLSMHLNLAIAWLLIAMLQRKFASPTYHLFAFLTVAFFSFINVLLSSKMGLITMVFVFIGMLIYYIISHKKYIIGITGILLIAISFYSLIRFVPAIGNRMNSITAVLKNPKIDKSNSESSAVRLLVWTASNQVISKNVYLGTGTGDAKDELMKEYQKQGMTGAFNSKLNTHNEFYQIFVTIGLLGFIVFSISLIAPFALAIKTSNTIYTFFLIIMIFNFLAESMLETQAGVMFYAFFNSLLCFNHTTPTITNTPSA